MKYNLGDSWDGFDAGEYVYDERKEKKWRTGIWKVSICLTSLIILYLITDHIKEIRLVMEGTMIEAEYDEEKGIARYRDDKGMLHTYNMSSYFPAHEGGTIKLYYIGSVNYAMPRNTLASRVFYYLFFGAILAVSLWRLKKNS